MAWSNSALVEYLYGIRQVQRVNAQGRSEIVSERVTEYKWADKPPIPAGFFFLPDCENISVVLANPSGTLPKFNRMGFLAGFGNRRYQKLTSKNGKFYFTLKAANFQVIGNSEMYESESSRD